MQWGCSQFWIKLRYYKISFCTNAISNNFWNFKKCSGNYEDKVYTVATAKKFWALRKLNILRKRLIFLMQWTHYLLLIFPGAHFSNTVLNILYNYIYLMKLAFSVTVILLGWPLKLKNSFHRKKAISLALKRRTIVLLICN